MKDGTVFMYHERGVPSWWGGVVGKLIGFFTRSDFVHASIYLEGFVWEASLKGPVRGRELPEQDGLVTLEPVRELSDAEKRRMKHYLASKLGPGHYYNVFKLCALMVVCFTRRVWNKLGWVPFQNDFFGVICSVYVDEAYKAAGIDLLPNENAEYTVPADFARSSKLQRV